MSVLGSGGLSPSGPPSGSANEVDTKGTAKRKVAKDNATTSNLKCFIEYVSHLDGSLGQKIRNLVRVLRDF